MKRYRTSIVSSIITAILICGMLAACGAAEKQAENLSGDGTHPNTVYDAQPTEPEAANPETTPEETEPKVTEPEITEPEEPEIEVTVPEVAEPEMPDEKIDVLDSNIANTIIETATAQLGVPYASGGSSPEDGFDSSGFVYYCVRAAGIDFPRQISSQLNAGEKIAYGDLAPGDVVYFSAEPGESASFCGIYVGGGLIIYSPVPDDTVKTANITTNYWTTRFVTGIRPTIN